LLRLSRYTVLIDACVLYAAPVRDLLVELAGRELFRAKWTAAIQDEWVKALLNNRPELEVGKLRRTVELMNQNVMDCMVEGHDALIEALDLPDPGDRHVLAAAIHANCDAIVTFNRRDFPGNVLDQYNIELLHPDDFLHFQFDLGDAQVITAVQRIRSRLKNPPLTAAQYLDRLELQGLPKIVAELRPYEQVLSINA
jgi:predicted nucleic acid-binding protein